MKKDKQVFTGPALILPDKIPALWSQLSTPIPNDLLNKEGEYNDSGTFQIRGGTAILEVYGPLTYHRNFFSWWYGWSTYEGLARDFNLLLNKKHVDNIILKIDSPGGLAFGLEELVDMFFQARGKKKLAAFISGYGASAAYGIASSAGVIVASKGAWSGSIGTVIHLTDDTEAKQMEGLKEITVVSKQSPDKAPDFNTQKGINLLQGLADQGGESFVSFVARNRDVSIETVLKDFGKGWIMDSYPAQQVGLVDYVDSLENLISALEKSDSAGNLALQTQPENSMVLNDEDKKEISELIADNIAKTLKGPLATLEDIQGKMKTMGETVEGLNQQTNPDDGDLDESGQKPEGKNQASEGEEDHDDGDQENGDLEKKIKDLEAKNEALEKENKELKEDPEDPQGGRIHGENSSEGAHPGY
jgi:ClpP class serine protease